MCRHFKLRGYYNLIWMVTVAVDAEGTAGVGGTASDAPERETQRVHRETEAARGRTDERSTGGEETTPPCRTQSNLHLGKFYLSFVCSGTFDLFATFCEQYLVCLSNHFKTVTKTVVWTVIKSGFTR